MTFNQQLIEKARKGEIAILNDGSVEELRDVLDATWPEDEFISNAEDTFYWASDRYKNNWCSGEFHPTKISSAHSVKEFIMNTIDGKGSESKDLSSVPVMQVEQPRTYKVTRQQMKQIWEAMNHPGGKLVIRNIISEQFDELENEAEITEGTIQRLEALPDIGAILRSIFPAYFYIPEGEPVLYKCDKHAPYRIGVSNGNGHVFLDHQTTGLTLTVHCVIPFTKNPQS